MPKGNLTAIIRENKYFCFGRRQLAKSKKFKYVSYILRFAVAGAALYWAFHKVDLREVSEKLFTLNVWVVLLALGAWLASQFIFVSRWLLLLRVQSIKISYWAAFRLHFLGIFYNNCLPSAVGGDFVRAGYATAHTDKKVEAVLSVFVDRFVGITSMILMAAACYWLIPVEGQRLTVSGQNGGEPSLVGKISGYWWIFAIIAGVILFVFLCFLVNPKTRALLGKGFAFVLQSGAAILKKSHKAMIIYWNHKMAFILAYFLSFLCQGVLIAGMLLIGKNLGIECPAKYYFVFFPVAWMIGAVPVSVGGLGIWENVLIGFFVAVGTQEDIAGRASALALFHRALWLFGSLPGVVIHLAGAHLPKDFSIDDNSTFR